MVRWFLLVAMVDVVRTSLSMSSMPSCTCNDGMQCYGTILTIDRERRETQVLVREIKVDSSLGTSHDIYLHKATAPDSRGETLFIKYLCSGQIQ